MGIMKEGFDVANDADGYLQICDWNAKSRKKLFSGRSDESEKFKQTKRVNRKSPVTRLELLDEDESAAASTSTVIPGVIARLMGLDSLPKSNNDHDSTAIFCNRNLEHFQDTRISSFMKLPSQDDLEPYCKTSWPINKFQTETLLPKSAKSKKFQSPVKHTHYIQPVDDDGHVIEAADDITEMRPQAGKKTTLPQLGSSSCSLKLRDPKKKLQASKRQSKLSEYSQRSSALNSTNRSLNVAVDTRTSSLKIFPDPEGSSLGVGKSVSLAVLAKENVRRRAGLAHLQEAGESNPSKLITSHLQTQKNPIREPNIENNSKILRQNNQKQNKILGRGNSPVKSKSRDGRAHCAADDSSSIMQCNLSSIAEKSCRKLGSEVRDDKKKNLCSGLGKIVSRRKQCTDRDHQSGKVQASSCSFSNTKGSKVITRSSAIVNEKSRGNQDISRTEADAISFTFTAPLTRSRPASGRSVEAVSPDSQSKRSPLSTVGIKDDDPLNTMLKQMLQGLTNEANISQQNSEKVLRLPVDFKPPSPVSVLEHSNSTDSSESSDSNSTGGGGQCSSITYQDMPTTMLHSPDGDTELLDSASSIFDGTLMERQETTLTSEPKGWELECVKDMLHNIEKTFKDYALGRNGKIINNHHIFDQWESKRGSFEHHGLIPGNNTRLLFDYVNECLDSRCRIYVDGGFKLWAKVMQIITRKDTLAQDVYKEMCDLGTMKDFMVDGLVDWDMSNRNGRWLSFNTEVSELGRQIESRILDSLIYELIFYILGF